MWILKNPKDICNKKWIDKIRKIIDRCIVLPHQIENALDKATYVNRFEGILCTIENYHEADNNMWLSILIEQTIPLK